MKRITMTAGAAALAGVVLLAGCSGSGGKLSKGGLADPGRPVFSAKGAPAAAPGGPVAGDASVRGSQGGPAAGGQGGGGAGSKTILTPAALIRTADLTVEVAQGSNVAAQANRAEQIVTTAGGQVFADDRTAGTAPTAALTLKVPGESLVSVVERLSALGKEKSRRSSTRDVTTQVADVSSRVSSARASIARLRLLFAQATKIGDVIALESELSQREAELESLQAQQRSLASQTDMATVTLYLSTAAPGVAPKHRGSNGFLGGLSRGWRAFTSAASALAVGVGAALPFLALALLIAGAVTVLRRRSRGGPAPVIAPPDAA